MSGPILAVTMGDPAGVGPEIAVRALAKPPLRRRCRPLLVGSADVFGKAADLVEAEVVVQPVDSAAAAAETDPAALAVLEPEGLADLEFERGEISPICGEAAYRCVEAAARMALDGRVEAVVTNPIHKKALHLAGHPYAGHTELLRELTGAASSAMMLVHGSLRVAHVTTHCSLREAAERCRADRILEVTRLTDGAIRRLGIQRPRIGVAALNPHASDEGLFGEEERTEIEPAVRRARQEGIDVTGPLPADTIFSLARGGRFDAVVAQYHDQGHIAVKLLGFRYDGETGRWMSVAGLNVTLGLPILRVSVDHGTAFDRAWTGQADPGSLESAVRFALRMLGNAGS
ncbi:MAG: 4-hydroxythreonine-4-phosphate dehydrogenase PdxA [Planctomycetota bacterium]